MNLDVIKAPLQSGAAKTGVIDRVTHPFATRTPEQVLKGGKKAYFKNQAAKAEK